MDQRHRAAWRWLTGARVTVRLSGYGDGDGHGLSGAHWLESVDSSLMHGSSAEMTASLLKILQNADTFDAAATRTSASLSCSSRTNAGTSSVLGAAESGNQADVCYR